MGYFLRCLVHPTVRVIAVTMRIIIKMLAVVFVAHVHGRRHASKQDEVEGQASVTLAPQPVEKLAAINVDIKEHEGKGRQWDSVPASRRKKPIPASRRKKPRPVWHPNEPAGR